MNLETVAQLYLDAAIDPSLWTKAMNATAEYGGAHGATLLPVRGRVTAVPYSETLEDAFKVYFGEGWYLRDERERGLKKMRQTGIFTDQDFASREEMASLDYFQGFLAPHSMNWGAGIGIQNGDDELCLMLQRGDKQGHFTDAEQAKLLKLQAPLQQASLLGSHLALAKAHGIGDAFDLIGSASILINRFGKVFRFNTSAEAYLEDGLSIIGDELACSLPSDTTALRRMIFACCVQNILGDNGTPRSIIIQRPSKRPLVLQVAKLSGMAGDIFSPARIILFIVDPFAERQGAPSDEIRKVFKLTAAEAGLLMILETELPLPRAAEQLGISYETARTHIKGILQKMGCKRQSDAIALVRRMSVRLTG